MTTATATSSYDIVKELLAEVIGEDFIGEYDLSPESTLTGDLEMESIEVVELAEKVKSKYSNINMSEWIAKLNLEQLLALNIGDIVGFIDDANS